MCSTLSNELPEAKKEVIELRENVRLLEKEMAQQASKMAEAEQAAEDSTRALLEHQRKTSIDAQIRFAEGSIAPIQPWDGAVTSRVAAFESNMSTPIEKHELRPHHPPSGQTESDGQDNCFGDDNLITLPASLGDSTSVSLAPNHQHSKKDHLDKRECIGANGPLESTESLDHSSSVALPKEHEDVAHFTPPTPEEAFQIHVSVVTNTESCPTDVALSPLPQDTLLKDASNTGAAEHASVAIEDKAVQCNLNSEGKDAEARSSRAIQNWTLFYQFIKLEKETKAMLSHPDDNAVDGGVDNRGYYTSYQRPEPGRRRRHRSSEICVVQGRSPRMYFEGERTVAVRSTLRSFDINKPHR